MKFAERESKLIESEDARLQSHVRKSPFAEVLGLEPIEAKPGHVLLRLPFSENLLQSLGRVHGGALFSLADHASGWAAYSMLEKNERCATLEMKINYIAALHDEVRGLCLSAGCGFTVVLDTDFAPDYLINLQWFASFRRSSGIDWEI
ncbi:MAG TPA: PaaI family thioesterase, partial [Blastocatellia bacterium]|nr:PaaI family thioesterase [Blastocatellia bacterium]